MATTVGTDLSRDRISNLADSTLVTILSRLCMDEAARCSILSSRWRHLFPSTLLNFRAFTRSGRNVVKAVTSILAAYPDEPVLSLRTGMLFFRPQDKAAVDVWLRDLSNRGIEELSLWFGFDEKRRPIPESLFACSSLRRLHVINGTFPDTTEAAAASLARLTKIELSDVRISQNSINSLLSQCTVLEHLTIKFTGRLDSLRLRSRSLKVLNSTGDFEKLVIDDAPNLERVVDKLMNQRKVHIEVVYAPKLEFLGYLGMSNEIGIGDTIFKGEIMRVETLMPRIKTLAVEMSYMKEGYTTWFMQLLRLFPHLETLYIKRDSSYMVEFTAPGSWEMRRPIPCILNHLEKVVFEVFRGHKWEMEMAKFFHRRSDFLKTMEFHCMDDKSKEDYGGPPSELWVRKQKKLLCLDGRAAEDALFQFFKRPLAENHHEHCDDERYQRDYYRDMYDV
ncbi:F-box/FBD/LRR-repeat protein At5g56420-like [Lolium rigidum]|uniref:F-box/FBD/LRR-repeat protein At5g56420-like n=1 Tax=Lolium rigidum TaxID=89674 RepID=UPI001F5D5D1E|nr:F-box/FBD/LRR-repeat protein At5g56420-like [Lolium rigidum]